MEEIRAPVRTCIGCGRKRERAALVRIVAVEGEVVVDRQTRLPGRGAWLCGSPCVAPAVKRKAFGRAFRGKVGRVDPGRLELALGGAGLQVSQIGLDAAPRRNGDAAPEG